MLLEHLPVEAPAGITQAIEAARPFSEAISGAGEVRHAPARDREHRCRCGRRLAESHSRSGIARADIRLPVGVSTG